MTSHIVVTRPGYDLSAVPPAAALEGRIVDLRGAAAARVSEIVNTAEGERIFLTDSVMMDISATDIRRAARADADEQLARLVPVSVAKYIRKYGLYRDTNER